jgi:hypothetical protein
MIRTVRLLSLVGAVGLVLALPTATALAADATGCSGSAISYDANGVEIGRAFAPGAGGTEDAPLPIDTAGKVQWEGKTDAVITNGSYQVTIGGLTFAEGTFANDEGATQAEGVQDMSGIPGLLGKTLTDKMKILVEGKVTSADASCSASGYVTGVTPPTSSPVFYGGLIAGAVGVAMAAGVIAGTKATAAAAASGGGGAA